MSGVDVWPVWRDRLVSPSDINIFCEGGARLEGRRKSSVQGNPLISYVTVVRNNEKDIQRTIDSVQSQTYKHVEHIILDGASTDRTLKIIKNYGAAIDYFASDPDKGLYDALNKAIPLCRGDLICVLNSDDWLPDDAAALVAREYNDGSNSECLILGSANVQISEDDRVKWTPSVVSSNSYFSIANVCHNAIYASKSAYEKSGMYDAGLRIASDFKWIMSCFDSGISFVYVEDVLVNYSLGGVSSDSDKHFDECIKVAREKFFFLSRDEASSLLYIFYPWKEALSDERTVCVEVDKYLNDICNKYCSFEEFCNSLVIGFEPVERSGLRGFLYRISPRFYGFIKGLKNMLFA